MIAYPAISPLSADRHALDLVIGLTGLVDRHRPESLIVFTGMRTKCLLLCMLKFATIIMIKKFNTRPT